MEQDDEITPLKVTKGHNPTFGPGEDWFLNACVGTNTGANPWEGYHGGFQAGAEVLLAAAGVRFWMIGSGRTTSIGWRRDAWLG